MIGIDITAYHTVQTNALFELPVKKEDVKMDVVI